MTKRTIRAALVAAVGLTALAAALATAPHATRPAPAGALPVAAVSATTKPDADGAVLAFGATHAYGSPHALASPVVGMAAIGDGRGYWVATAAGNVYPFGDARFHGSLAGQHLWSPIVGIAAVPKVGGYLLVARDGEVYAFGAARSYGSLTDDHLPAPIVAMVVTPAGTGYWLAGAGGAVYAFGGARLHGSLAGRHLDTPVVGVAVAPGGAGYWLATAGGGVYPFGSAADDGSLAGRHLAHPIAGIAADPTGGYWLVGDGGTVTPFGPAPALGSAGTTATTHLVVGIVAPTAGAGYWLAEGEARLPLDGKVVVLDPGHNGRSYTDPAYIDRQIWNGREYEDCDTTGTETDGGYTEALFNWRVANDVAADLRAEGATVILTRTSNDGVGPCVTVRTEIGNEAYADAALSIHADGGPPGGRGYAILEPVADGPNDAVIGSSDRLGTALRDAFGAVTHTQVSTYDGVDGIQARDDLAGVNLTRVPKVFIECANMRNAADAALVVRTSWQELAAKGIARGLADFLAG